MVRMRCKVRRSSAPKSRIVPGRFRPKRSESGLVSSGHNPTLVGHTRRIGTHSDEVATKLNHPEILFYFLRNNVTENAPLLAFEIFAGCAQFVQHAAGHECSGGHLRSGMLELLARAISVILEDADVLEAAVTFKILDALCCEQQKLLELEVACIPEVPIVDGVFNQNFVRADRAHLIVNAVPAPGGFALNVIQRSGVNDGARRPGSAGRTGNVCNELWWFARVGTEPAESSWARRVMGNVVAGNNPRASNRILAKFHA